MRDLATLAKYRATDLERKAGLVGHPFEGVFEVPSKSDGRTLRIVLSARSYGWDHVSISAKKRPPNWQEMEQIRRLFFEDHEAVMQYHAPVAEYIDGSVLGHPFRLHLWRPCHQAIPKPPAFMVGGLTPKEAHKAALAYEAEHGIGEDG